MQTIVPAQYIGPPKGNGDQNVQHNCCKWSNVNNEEDDRAYKCHNISPSQNGHLPLLLLFEGTEGSEFGVPQFQQKLKSHNGTLPLVDVNSLG